MLLNAGYSPPFKAFVDRDDPVQLLSYHYIILSCIVGGTLPLCVQVSVKITVSGKTSLNAYLQVLRNAGYNKLFRVV